MKRSSLVTLVAWCFLTFAGSSSAQEILPEPVIPATGVVPGVEAVWNNGLFIQTKEKDFTAHVGGVLQLDGAWYSGGTGLQTFPGGIGRLNDGVVPRRTRIFFEGTAYKHFDYLVNYEFANGVGPIGSTGAVTTANVVFTPGLLDAWVTVKDVPFLGNVRIGNQKEWFSLEHLNSARFLEFIERSYLFDFSQPTAFNNGRTPGVSTFRTWMEDRVFTALGVYKNQSDPYAFGVGDGEYAITGRVAALPIYDADAHKLWHIGGAFSHRDPANDQVRVRIRNAARGSPGPLLNLIADSGALDVNSQDLFNLETAAVNGPFTLQAEYTANVLNGARPLGSVLPRETLMFHGGYVETLLFLTGESRSWNPKTATFNRVIPKRHLMSSDGGFGAIEVGVRYSHLNLSDENIRGGRLNAVTLGLNWYWNPNMKWQFNYDYAYRDRAENPLAHGSIHSFVSRLALDF
jgi:phosphate-selective porin OprO and OprP